MEEGFLYPLYPLYPYIYTIFVASLRQKRASHGRGTTDTDPPRNLLSRMEKGVSCLYPALFHHAGYNGYRRRFLNPSAGTITYVQRPGVAPSPYSISHREYCCNNLRCPRFFRHHYHPPWYRGFHHAVHLPSQPPRHDQHFTDVGLY